MLKRNSRRVTLSSVDLENFLSEVSISDNQLQARRRTLSFQNNLSENVGTGNKFVIPLNDVENIQPNILKNTASVQIGSKTEKLTLVNPTVNPSQQPVPKVEIKTEVNESVNCNGVVSNEQLIRDYCKVCCVYSLRFH